MRNRGLSPIVDGTTTSVLAGAAIDEMIARYTNGQQSTYLTDGLGSVIAQLKDDQTVQNQYGYSPYGVTSKGANGTVDNAVDDKGNASQYTGRENDGTGLYYYRARYYMPGCGRFISEDPIGLGGGINLYGYVGGEPVGFGDPSGNAPGDNYCTVDAAGLAAVRDINPTSIAQNREYGGWIYKKWWNGKYSYDDPSKGEAAGLTMPSKPSISDTVAMYHTHAAYDRRYDNENFSDQDKRVSDAQKVPSYVGTPSGAIKRYVPESTRPMRGPISTISSDPSGSGCRSPSP